MPPPQLPRRNEIVDWYNSIPPITKAIFTLSVGTTVFSALGFIHPSSLILYWPNIITKLQLWRPISCFFLNSLGFRFAFNLYFLYRHSIQVENEVFNGQSADYLYFHIVTAGIQLAASKFLDMYVLSDGLLMSIAYIWAQYNRETIVSFMFGIQFKAIYLPWAMVISDFLMNGALPKAALVGIASAHIYYYLNTIYPSQGGRRYIQTPELLKRMFPPSRGFRSFGGQPQQPQQQTRTNMFGRHTWGTGHRLGS